MLTSVERKSDKCKSGEEMYLFIQLHPNHTEWRTPKNYWVC